MADSRALANALREALRKNADVHAWTLRARATRSREMYLVRARLESEREVRERRAEATLYTKNGERMGSAELTLTPGEESLAAERVTEAVALAAAGGITPFPLPGPTDLPAVETVDPAVGAAGRDTLESLRGRLVDTLARERNVQLAAAEFFLHDDEERFESSTGLTADRGGTRVAAEVVLLGRHGSEEAEFQDLRRRRRLEDLELETWVKELSAYARDAARAEAAPTWEGPVILGGDYLRAFLGPVIQQTSAQAAYVQAPSLELDAWVSGDRHRDDPLILASDPTVPFGNSSAPCDADGVPGRRAELVRGGKFKRHWAEQRYAHYMEIPATGTFANLDVGAGSRWERDLRGEAGILEVVRFSWLNPNGATGDFASEMRFGYLSRGMARVPVKGGSLNGNVFRALSRCHFSREVGFYGDTRGPRAFRLDRLQLAGA